MKKCKCLTDRNTKNMNSIQFRNRTEACVDNKFIDGNRFFSKFVNWFFYPSIIFTHFFLFRGAGAGGALNGWCFTMQMDNHLKHTAKATQDFLEANKYSSMNKSVTWSKCNPTCFSGTEDKIEGIDIYKPAASEGGCSDSLALHLYGEIMVISMSSRPQIVNDWRVDVSIQNYGYAS